MKNVHHIVPVRKLFREAMFRRSVLFWAKGFISCAGYQESIKKEIEQWPEEFIFFIQFFPLKFCLGVGKNKKSLHIIKGNLPVHGDVILFFKSFAAARCVFSGKTPIIQSFIQNKLLLKGDPAYGMSVLKSLMISESFLFPKLAGERRKMHLLQRYLLRIKIYSDIFLKRISKKEANLCDTQVLRVFE